MPRSCCLLAVSPEGSRRSADLPVQESFWLRGDDVWDIKSWHWKEQTPQRVPVSLGCAVPPITPSTSPDTGCSEWTNGVSSCSGGSCLSANPTLYLLTPDLLQDGFSHVLSPFCPARLCELIPGGQGTRRAGGKVIPEGWAPLKHGAKRPRAMMTSHPSRGAPGAAARARPGPAGTAGASAQLRPHQSHSAHSLDLPLTSARPPPQPALERTSCSARKCCKWPILPPSLPGQHLNQLSRTKAALSPPQPRCLQSRLAHGADPRLLVPPRLLLPDTGVEQWVKMQSLYWALSQCNTSVNSLCSHT